MARAWCDLRPNTCSCDSTTTWVWMRPCFRPRLSWLRISTRAQRRVLRIQVGVSNECSTSPLHSRNNQANENRFFMTVVPQRHVRLYACNGGRVYLYLIAGITALSEDQLNAAVVYELSRMLMDTAKVKSADGELHSCKHSAMRGYYGWVHARARAKPSRAFLHKQRGKRT